MVFKLQVHFEKIILLATFRPATSSMILLRAKMFISMNPKSHVFGQFCKISADVREGELFPHISRKQTDEGRI